MDKVTMVDTDLSDELIGAGKSLVLRLDEQNLSPTSAFWFLTDAGVWKLILAEPSIGKSGPRELYKQIQKILRESPKVFGSLSLDDVALIKPTDSAAALLRVAVRTGPGIGGVRFSRNVVNGVLIEDAYIYRST